MAKKTTGAKKVSKKATTPSAELIQQAFGECAFAIGRGVERVACENGADVTKRREITLSRQAAAFWAKRYSVTVPRGLKHGNWIKDREIVLAMSDLLGVKAAKLAIAAAPAGQKVVIESAHVKAASKEIEHDAHCRAGMNAPAGPSGGGIYCQTD